MRTTITSDPAPGHDNEDFAVATENVAILLDGAGLSGVDDGGCIHGVAWYVRQLGAQLLIWLLSESEPDLREVLAEAIGSVADAHRSTCDLEHPGTPSSTVIIVHEAAGVLRYLVLADSVLVIDAGDEPIVISDTREAAVGRRYRAAMDALVGGTPEHDEARRSYVGRLRQHRNQPDGFWVAASAPEAAQHGLTGRLPSSRLQSVLLLSDGASRLVDRFGLWTWSKLAEVATTHGGVSVLQAVRDAEREDAAGERWPRGKVFDDATIVVCDRFRSLTSTGKTAR
ncbi:hypothetical protein [Rhizomonospora bruguierae]|uniref:hypothetical protein n=1 Tax=Rhizomonospora bruguierae TaxID=1581705 RepID=UPI001BCF6886|nr:hypothetical protein [Micromonospora sp. NBRC 107566]